MICLYGIIKRRHIQEKPRKSTPYDKQYFRQISLILYGFIWFSVLPSTSPYLQFLI